MLLVGDDLMLGNEEDLFTPPMPGETSPLLEAPMAKVTLLAMANRSGSFTTPSFLVPNTISERACEFHMLLNEADTLDSALSVKLSVDISDDGNIWRYKGGIVYNGGIHDLLVTNPGIGFPNAAKFRGKYIRMRLESNKQVRIGAEIEDKI